MAGADGKTPAERVPVRNLDTRIRKLRGTILVAGPEEVLELGETATFVWNHIDGTRTIAEIGAALASEYDVDAETATADVAELVDDLLASEIVSLRDAS
jgi:pyrroloquinoline quinone biosynthesis protein D